ncbi:flagellar transcriptional regulator FlhC [Cupriavidus gilardii]|uniref:Flagellar transcriptional regulator FlhC n=2 Tax=Cupriavidus TaxID=106589 RepID=A0A6N1BGY4_9BURK|nr:MULTISPECIES: flagellar transcriptional regulator FlhC [Cupriavidus]ALD93612.1 transcriptional activator FlhC [Cupriavidus gilardii CR3]QQE08914.1 flagellar transcriptional regulator FlhC [Cupriavidus sp. ISTL7]KAA6116887.1 flagellar transcriptional regulator FlhC [Cupriavidus cauae]KAB0595630.1 flagellar transcriptional regulator FlhC [Cupriavidus gilardii]MCT9013532.1 flagellar transcriptional regulator FlhC [Cupriavidus gilardii]
MSALLQVQPARSYTAAPAAPRKSVLQDANQTQLAIELIGLGARLQVLEAETTLSRDRLIRLYKELRGVSPPKGMLPFSTDWFTTWLPNIHSSLFFSAYQFMVEQGEASGIRAVVAAYRLYLEHVSLLGGEIVLSFTRAWTLVRFFESNMLQLSSCTCCGGQFVTHAYEPNANFVCSLCRPPSRAGKAKKPSKDATPAQPA